MGSHSMLLNERVPLCVIVSLLIAFRENTAGHCSYQCKILHLGEESFSAAFLSIYFSFLFFFWLQCVFIAACGLSLVAVSRGYSSLWCAGFSLWWLLLLRSMGCRHVSSVLVACELSSCGV